MEIKSQVRTVESFDVTEMSEYTWLEVIHDGGCISHVYFNRGEEIDMFITSGDNLPTHVAISNGSNTFSVMLQCDNELSFVTKIFVSEANVKIHVVALADSL